MKNLEIFINRINKLGIDIKYFGNYPWVYFDTINGNKVKERFHSEHGFVVFIGDTMPDIKRTFETIRKYR